MPTQDAIEYAIDQLSQLKIAIVATITMNIKEIEVYAKYHRFDSAAALSHRNLALNPVEETLKMRIAELQKQLPQNAVYPDLYKAVAILVTALQPNAFHRKDTTDALMIALKDRFMPGHLAIVDFFFEDLTDLELAYLVLGAKPEEADAIYEDYDDGQSVRNLVESMLKVAREKVSV